MRSDRFVRQKLRSSLIVYEIGRELGISRKRAIGKKYRDRYCIFVLYMKYENLSPLASCTNYEVSVSFEIFLNGREISEGHIFDSKSSITPSDQ